MSPSAGTSSARLREHSGNSLEYINSESEVGRVNRIQILIFAELKCTAQIPLMRFKPLRC